MANEKLITVHEGPDQGRWVWSPPLQQCFFYTPNARKPIHTLTLTVPENTLNGALKACFRTMLSWSRLLN